MRLTATSSPRIDEKPTKTPSMIQVERAPRSPQRRPPASGRRLDLTPSRHGVEAPSVVTLASKSIPSSPRERTSSIDCTLGLELAVGGGDARRGGRQLAAQRRGDGAELARRGRAVGVREIAGEEALGGAAGGRLLRAQDPGRRIGLVVRVHGLALALALVLDVGSWAGASEADPAIALAAAEHHDHDRRDTASRTVRRAAGPAPKFRRTRHLPYDLYHGTIGLYHRTSRVRIRSDRRHQAVLGDPVCMRARRFSHVLISHFVLDLFVVQQN